MVENTVDCAVACVNGCILGDKCPKREYAEATSNFIENTSLGKNARNSRGSGEKETDGTPQMGNS